jgi:hypothetical protein
MSNESHDNLNKLLARHQGSVNERYDRAKGLNDEDLAKAASAGIPQAIEVQQQRRHESLLAAMKQVGSQETGNAVEFAYVDPTRLSELRAVSSSQFDLTNRAANLLRSPCNTWKILQEILLMHIFIIRSGPKK